MSYPLEIGCTLLPWSQETIDTEVKATLSDTHVGYPAKIPKSIKIIWKYYKYPMLELNQGLCVEILQFLGFIWSLRDLTQKGQGTNVSVGSPWPLIRDQTNKPIPAIIVTARVTHQSPISLG